MKEWKKVKGFQFLNVKLEVSWNKICQHQLEVSVKIWLKIVSISMSFHKRCQRRRWKYYMEIIQGVQILPGLVLVLFQELLEPGFNDNVVLIERLPWLKCWQHVVKEVQGVTLATKSRLPWGSYPDRPGQLSRKLPPVSRNINSVSI